MTNAALEFITRRAEYPFLLHIHWTIPHANNEGGRVVGDGMEIPDYGIYRDQDWPNPEKGFAAMVSHMDTDVGRLMKLLTKLKIDHKTLVIFTSDNGPHNEGEHNHEFFNSNGVLKGFKRSMHEGGIRVPLIARWPGNIAAGTSSEHQSGFYDFLPTACEVANVEAPADIDGISYAPTLLGRNSQQQHEYLYCASQEGLTSVGVRYGKWKLVKYRKTPNGPDKSEDWRLYDLAHDIAETQNIAAQHTDVVKVILSLLRRDGLL